MNSTMKHMDLMRGICIGLIAGGAISMTLSSGRRRRKRCRDHTIKAVGDVVGNVTDMLGM